MDNFEEASIEEVNLLGQPNDVIHPDLAIPGSSETGLENIASLQLSESVTVLDVQHADPELPLPEKDLETDAKAKSESSANLSDLKSDCQTVFVPDKSLSGMDSVSLSDGEETVDKNADEKCNKNVITNVEVDKNAEKENSDYLLERIRELKDERDRVCVINVSYTL